MSFSYYPIPEGSGPLADIFANLTFEMVAYYLVSWLYYIFHSSWFAWLIYAALVYLAIRIIMNWINAFNSSRQEPVD